MTSRYVTLSEIFFMMVIAQSFRVESILSSQSTFEEICNASTDIALDFSVAHPSADVDVAQTRVQQTFSALPRETAVLPGQDYNCIILKKTLSRSHPAICSNAHPKLTIVQPQNLNFSARYGLLFVINPCTTKSLFFFSNQNQ